MDQKLIDLVEELICLDDAVIAIDGRCGSGKTTLAQYLSDYFGGRIIHMDDFFLPPELRSGERLIIPGENIHWERFMDEVAPHLRGCPLEFRAFCCQTGLTVQKKLASSALTIVEGSYCMHPALRELYDLSIFCDISPAEQKNRILSREKERAKMFFEKWIPLEEKYFGAFNVKASCDIIYNTEKNAC